MFGGGEEYFQPPPAYDRETLARFSLFCSRLRKLEQAGKTNISECCNLAREVGETVEAYELVVGSIFRHIKTSKGKRQLACWYVLDKLCKEHKAKYAFCAQKYLLDIGREYIPFEDPEFQRKYETLVERWTNVFPEHIVKEIWLSKRDRVFAAEHPAEYERQMKAEEEEWRRTELAMQNEDGLNIFDQPCIDYLKGKCPFGNSCPLFHPPDWKDTLPPECRMGDWKCSKCGVINRHFRKSCTFCKGDKPQYKRSRQPPIEDVLLSSPDPAVTEILHQQFGYNPYEEEEAVALWKRRITSFPAYKAERCAAYKVRILHHRPTNALEEHAQRQKHFAEPAVLDTLDVDLPSGSAVKRLRTEQLLPFDTPPEKAVGILSQLAVERGVRDPMAPNIYEALGDSIYAVAEDSSVSLSAPTAEKVIDVCSLARRALAADPESMGFLRVFFNSIRGVEGNLGLTALQKDQLCNLFVH